MKYIFLYYFPEHRLGQHTMGQTNARRKMENGTHAPSRETSRPRINARRNDPNPVRYPSHLTDCLSQVERDIPKFISCKC